MFDLGSIRDITTAAATVDVRGMAADTLMASARELELAARRLDAARAHVLGELDATSATEIDSGMRTAGWISHHVPCEPRAMRNRVRLARRLRELPAADAALTAGRIGWDHVTVLDRAANPRIAEQIIEILPELIVLAEHLPYPAWSREVAFIAERFDQDGGHRPEADPARNRLHLSAGWHDELHLDGWFNPETGAELRGLIDEAADRLWRRYRDLREHDDTITMPSRAQLLAEALLELARGGSAVDLHSTAPPRPDITVIIQPDGNATLPDGTSLRHDLLESILGRAHHLHGVHLHADGSAAEPARTIDGVEPESPLGHVIALALGERPDRGSDTDRGPRFANRAMRRAAAARDGGCVFPGCTMPAAWTDLHHVTHWEHGGATELSNLASLCRFHHGVTHRLGWSMHATTDHWFWWQTPTGNTLWSQRSGIPRAGPPPPGAVHLPLAC